MTEQAEPAFWRMVAGFFAGPFAWAVHQQGNYMLVPVSCHERMMFLPMVTLATAAIALIGGSFSYGAWRRLGPPGGEENPERNNHRFLVGLSLLMTALFVFAILMQGAATLILSGCQR